MYTRKISSTLQVKTSQGPDVLCIKQFELGTSRIHNDTTSVTFQDHYAGSMKESRITHGFNEDHRLDFKKLVFGLNVASDGVVPIFQEVYSGNKTDDMLHWGNVQRLRELLDRNKYSQSQGECFYGR